MTNLRQTPWRIAVVGGGISGLAAAHALACARRGGAPVDEFLVEGCDRVGGVIHTESVEGFLLEGGPDSFLAEKPEAAALCRELSLGNSLMGSNDHDRRTYILLNGRLVPLPDGLMLLVPTRLWPMVTTRLLSLRSKIAMAAEWFTAPRADNADADEAVGDFVRRHFGDAMLENIADPLLAGVYGGDSTTLSVRSVLPRFWEMEREYGSLTRATLAAMKRRRAAPRKAAQPPPLFMTLKEGLGKIVSTLEGGLEKNRVHLRQRVLALEGGTGGAGSRYTIRCEAGATHAADAVILALPAHQSAAIVSLLDPRLGDLLGEIPYSSSMTVSLGYGLEIAGKLPPGFGFLVPRRERRRLLACTFVHAKFPHRAPEGKILLRCFLGGSRDPGVLNLEDEKVVSLVRRELKEILGLGVAPLFWRIYRWPASMAQYTVGHWERIRKIQAGLLAHPGCYLAGNAFSGIGISDCIRMGQTSVANALRFLQG